MELEELIEKIPEILKKRRDLAYKLYTILKEKFATIETLKEYFEKSDRRFHELLSELRAFREDTNERFKALTLEVNYQPLKK